MSPIEVFALALDLGNITSTSEPVVWSLGVIRNPVVSYTTGTGQSETRVPYYLAQYSNIPDAVNVSQCLVVEPRAKLIVVDRLFRRGLCGSISTGY